MKIEILPKREKEILMECFTNWKIDHVNDDEFFSLVENFPILPDANGFIQR